MSRRTKLCVCAFPALSTVLLASDGQAPVAASEAPTATAIERGVPALFSWGDVNGDGRLDLAAVNGVGTLQLLANTGDGRFEDVTERSGLGDVRNAALALWADYDGDGRVDLFVGARAGASRLFHNEDGVFIDMTTGSGFTSQGPVQLAQWLDYDADGRFDLLVVTKEKSKLFHGLSGGFFEVVNTSFADGVIDPVPSAVPMDPDGLVPPLDRGSPSEGGATPGRESRDGMGGRRSATGFGMNLTSIPSIATPFAAPIFACATAIRDQANPNTCLNASTTPALGMLYPISSNLFVAVGGNVGIGTTTPSAKLEVAGTARITDTLTLNPASDQALNVSTGSIYKGGVLFLHNKGSGNTAVGLAALSSVTTGLDNTAMGLSALLSNTSGSFNTATGKSALFANTTGIENTASGTNALRNNTTGFSNTASGAFALFSNTQGSSNTAHGRNALYKNTIGAINTAIGVDALYSNTTGLSNTAVGALSLLENTTASGNTAVGTEALRNNTTGSGNTGQGSRALFSNTTGSQNTATGDRALDATTSSENAAHGASALRANTTGNSNTAQGAKALRFNTTGSFNTGVGRSALYSNTTGTYNTATGINALGYNTTASNNTAHGGQALRANTTGADNTASGARALRSNTAGTFNTGVGRSALYYNTTGTYNTGTGLNVLFHNTTASGNTAHGAQSLFNSTGTNNTASGFNALRNNTTGSRNIAVGANAGSNLTTGSDNIDIGDGGVAGESATIRIGIVGTQTRAFIAGIRGVTTGVANAIPVLVDSSGQLGTVSSSRRFKRDITDMGDATKRLLELRPVVFRYKQEQALPSGDVPVEYGLIAEEVAEIFPDLVVYGDDGKPLTVKYHVLSSMLLNELKQMGGRIETQNEEHAREMGELRSRLAALESRASPAPMASPRGH